MNFEKDLAEILQNFFRQNKNWDAHFLSRYITTEIEKLGYNVSQHGKVFENFMCPNCGQKEFTKFAKTKSEVILAKEGFCDISKDENIEYEVVCKKCSAEIDYNKSIECGRIVVKNIPLKATDLPFNEVPGLNETVKKEDTWGIEDSIKLSNRSPIQI